MTELHVAWPLAPFCPHSLPSPWHPSSSRAHPCARPWAARWCNGSCLPSGRVLPHYLLLWGSSTDGSICGPPIIPLCPSPYFFVLSTDHPPLHHISMYLLVYSLSPGMPPSSVRMGTLSGSLCVSGAGRNFWKTVDAPTFVKWVLYLKELTLSFVETIKINLCIFLA